MLVLTRKLQEQVRIGNNVTVTVLRVKGNTVRLGIEAPRDVSILRGELPRFDEETEPLPGVTQEAIEMESGMEGAAEPLPSESVNSMPESPTDDGDEPAIVDELTSKGRALAARVEECLRRDAVNVIVADGCTQ